MLKKWFCRILDGIRPKNGWHVLLKPIFDLTTVVVAVLTALAIVEQLKSLQWTEALSRGDKIASDLQSDKDWARIAGLRALQTFPFQFRYVSVPPYASSLAPFELSKSAILLQFERFRARRKTLHSLDKPAEVAGNSAQSDASLSELEKTLSLKVLSNLGAAGWYHAIRTKNNAFGG